MKKLLLSGSIVFGCVLFASAQSKDEAAKIAANSRANASMAKLNASASKTTTQSVDLSAISGSKSAARSAFKAAAANQAAKNKAALEQKNQTPAKPVVSVLDKKRGVKTN
jgi:N-methylhydantoinase B/oxoprolinase/acetone carboxylase alpha subunit